MPFQNKTVANSKWLIILFYFILFAVVVLTIFFLYIGKLNFEKPQLTLLEEAQEFAFLSDKHMTQKTEELELMAQEIERMGNLISDESMQYLNQKVEEYFFIRAVVAFPYGMGYSTDGHVVDNDYDFFEKSMKGATSISGLAYWNNDVEEYITLSVPIYREGTVIAVLYAQYEILNSSLYNLDDFTTEATSLFFVNENGKLVNSNENTESLFANFMELKREGISVRMNAEISEKVERRNSGTVSFLYKSDEYYLAFAPCMLSDWYALILTHQKNIGNFRAQIVIFLGLIILFLLIVAVIFVRVIRNLKVNTSRLADFKSVYSILGQTMTTGFIKRKDTSLGEIIYMNNFFSNTLGYSHEELEEKIENQFINLLDLEIRYKWKQTIDLQLAEGNTFEFSYQAKNKEGKNLWFHEEGHRVTDSKGNSFIFSITMNSMKQRKLFDDAVETNLLYRFILDKHDIYDFVWDIPSNTLKGSNFAIEIFEQKEQFLDKAIIPFANSLIKEEDRDSLYTLFVRIPHELQESFCDIRILNTSGIYAWYRVSLYPQVISSSGELLSVVGSIIDIDEQKIKENELLTMASRDAFTSLLNKASTESNISHFLLSRLSTADPYSLMMIDLDLLKHVNDTYGHAVGDEVLLYIAATLSSVFREDKDIIGRIGGDEFMVMITSSFTHEQALSKATQIYKAFITRPFYREEVPVSISIGIAVFPFDGTTFEELYASADAALYYSKQNKKGSASLFLEIDKSAESKANKGHVIAEILSEKERA